MMSQRKKRLTTSQIIMLGFAGMILLGTALLMLPVSSRSREITSFPDALFTATSAVCVTGLVLHDTAGYWSAFGQAVLLALIQIGGMGVVTVASAITIVSGKKITLMQRSTMQEAISAPQVGGIVRLTDFIIRTTLIIELAGAAVMAPVFCRDFGLRGLWMALFHSVSAFCNAGFDLMGAEAPFSSLTAYRTSPLVNVTVMLLIVTGGIGFVTWDDIRVNRWHLRRYRMQSKVILFTTAVLLAVPAVYFYAVELGGFHGGERVLAALFQSVTARTAGFNTADLTAFTQAGQFLLIGLMLIGGSPGSTAGGMKTTTAAVLAANAWAVFRRDEQAHCFGRRIGDDAVRNAATIFLMYIVLFFTGGLIISLAEDLPIAACLFETASAIGTVGLSLGLTPGLGRLSQLVLIALMFFGRVGGLTIIFAALSGTRSSAARLPQEKITVG